MKRIALFAALTCLFALWQFPGVTMAGDYPQAGLLPVLKSTDAGSTCSASGQCSPAGGTVASSTYSESHRFRAVSRVREIRPVRAMLGALLPGRRCR